MEYIQYSLSGEVRDNQDYSIDRFLTNLVGEKIKISKYDLDEEKGN